jgi:hypothetical protein
MGAPDLTNPELLLLRSILSEGTVGPHAVEDHESDVSDDQAIVVSAYHGLEKQGLLHVDETIEVGYELDVEGVNAVENGLLEHRLWSWMSAQDTPTMKGLQDAFERSEAGPGVGLLKQLGVSLDNGTFLRHRTGRNRVSHCRTKGFSSMASRRRSSAKLCRFRRWCWRRRLG